MSQDNNNIPSSDDTALWVVADLADYLKISEHTIRRSIVNRRIPFIKLGRSVRFDPVVIKDFLKSNTRFPEER